MSKNTVCRWMQDQLDHGMDVVFHNAQYDLGWLLSEGLEVKGKIFSCNNIVNLIAPRSKSH